MSDVPDRGRVLGIPAAPDKQAKRQMIAVQQLPELIRRARNWKSWWSNSVPGLAARDGVIARSTPYVMNRQ
jgi:hypothetical protein